MGGPRCSHSREGWRVKTHVFEICGYSLRRIPDPKDGRRATRSGTGRTNRARHHGGDGTDRISPLDRLVSLVFILGVSEGAGTTKA